MGGHGGLQAEHKGSKAHGGLGLGSLGGGYNNPCTPGQHRRGSINLGLSKGLQCAEFFYCVDISSPPLAGKMPLFSIWYKDVPLSEAELNLSRTRLFVISILQAGHWTQAQFTLRSQQKALIQMPLRVCSFPLVTTSSCAQTLDAAGKPSPGAFLSPRLSGSAYFLLRKFSNSETYEISLYYFF